MSSELFRIVDTLSLDSDTVALSARQGKILNEKILSLTLFSISDGLVPIGAVIAVGGVFSGPNNTGVFKAAPTSDQNLSTSGLISKNGFQLCDGKKVAEGANASFLGNYVPNLTDDRFLKGSSVSGIVSGISGANKGDNTVVLGIEQMPAHDHVISTTVAAHAPVSLTVAGTAATAGHHGHSGETWGGGHEHLFWRTDRHYLEIEGAWQGRQYCGGNDRIDHWTWGGGNHYHSLSIYGAGDHSHSVSASGTIPQYNHTATSTCTTVGSGAAFNIEPKYLTCNYYIRVR